MAEPRPVIITCAVTGAIHTPSMSPYLPVTAADIVASAKEAAEAGAAVLHLHGRHEETGQPDQSVEAFRRIVKPLSAATNAVLNLTTGGSPYMTAAERVAPARDLAPRLASLNMGSMNLGLFPMLKRYSEFRNDWERTHLENSHDLVFRNTYSDISHILKTCRENGTRFEFECYDTSHLYNLAHFAESGAVEPPFFVQTVFGLMGGIGTHVDDITHMRRTAERLFGADLVWSALGAGAHQMRIAATVAASGGHVRVGLEDSLWSGPGRMAKSNAEQVRQVKKILQRLGLRAATPEEAAEILALSPTMFDKKGAM
ncbi:3-keto-5-aminohexanoate cleavage protein [uncultured Roseobacter sp.]|uniref:3-keto-5-aminohexanoate cleavage protein n=1 Tax=uncultured Roseobacter sp. TaxID=114847 RepID=UPI00260695AC|nr:3-keto-5-aminohexanoate cleavage protein [uncultured Roseobacter sp.]